MENNTTAVTTVTIDGEAIELDAVKDPRLGKMGLWHARGVYNKKYITAQGQGAQSAFENWEAKALGKTPPEPVPSEDKGRGRGRDS